MSTKRPDPPRGPKAVLVAMRTTTAGAPRGRRLAGLLLLVGLPVLISVLVVLYGEGGRGTGFSNFARMSKGVYFGLILPLALIFLGTGAFADEWAGGTAHYVVGQPISRLALVTGRWLATVRRALVLVLPAMALVYALQLGRFGGETLAHYAGDLLVVLGMVSALTMAYGAIFLQFGLFFKRSIVWSLVYVLLSEFMVSKLPQSVAMVSLDFHARNVIWQLTGASEFQPLSLNPDQFEPIRVWVSCASLVGITAVALGAAAVTLAFKEVGGEAQAQDGAT